MITLGIETSCDETSAALVQDGGGIRSNVVSSQVELHAGYGGVVPELAARSHIERLPLVVDEAFRRAGCDIDAIDLVAVTRGPGLIGALLVGVGFARGLALDRDLPLVGVSHLDGHIHSAFLEAPDLELPALVLIVSGGHTELVLVPEDGPYRVLGRTRDDAAGEAFDKVARLLGLPYPGGPEVDRLAATVDGPEAARQFPLPVIHVDGLDFSFSGIKTAVRYALERRLGRAPGSGLDPGGAQGLDSDLVAAACASFQMRVLEHLISKLKSAVTAVQPRTVAIAGGVARNSALRRQATQILERRGGGAAGPAPAMVVPSVDLCADNAAMIAAAGFHLWRRGEGGDLTVDPGLRLAAATG